MIIIFVLCLLALVAVLEMKWGPAALEQLSMTQDCDRLLAEPGEKITWTGKVSNQGRLPVFFVRLTKMLPQDIVFHEDPGWIRSNLKQMAVSLYMEERFSLMPGRTRESSLTFSFMKRGRYDMGGYRLSAGDLLGYLESSRDSEGHQHVVVIPARLEHEEALNAVGGFLGDISVRRFIMEDPILTAGFRDYTGREPMKDISWTRTAVVGRLQVRQFDHTSEQTVMVILNVEGGSHETLERCFSLTRMVCEELEHKHIPYAFCTNGQLLGPVGQIQWLADGLGSQHLDTLLYGLGQATYTCFYSLQTLVEQCRRHEKRGQSYILITPQLSVNERQLLRPLEETSGQPVCVLVGKEEE